MKKLRAHSMYEGIKGPLESESLFGPQNSAVFVKIHSVWHPRVRRQMLT